MRVYSPAKTVADCFKYRHKYGLDVAIEALRDGWRVKKFTMNELSKAAAVCRVSRVIQPYVEMLAGNTFNPRDIISVVKRSELSSEFILKWSGR
ncbi:MAG: hypothetical protein WCG63_07300 [Opitutaceae bacterium]